MRALTYLCRLAVVMALAASGTALVVMAGAPHVRQIFEANSSRSAEVKVDELARNSSLFASDGTFLGQLRGEQDRQLVTLDEIAPKTVRAILAVEDADFYSHSGINARAIVRALLDNVAAGSVQQGGSTITQQVVKNLVLDDDRQVADRKVPEAALALRLEKQMSKDQILELYLNTVYFGGGAYGVERAARLYFDKSAKDLDWAESALLASIIRSPTAYDPIRNPQVAEGRRRLTLERLVKLGDITQAEMREYASEPLPVERHATDVVQQSYFLEEVRLRLLDDPRLGATRQDRVETLYAGGLQIYTTIDLKAQAQAEQAIASVMDPIRDERGFTAALAAVEPSTGAVRALVGGPGFDAFKFDIATQKGRPTGSAFKMFVLAAAMEAGYVPNDVINGSSPCSFDNAGGTPNPYVAENFSGTGGGAASILSQTLRSSNCAYLRLAIVVGLSNVISTAHALGVTSPLDRVLSLPLGVMDITPLDMANSYATIANDGVRVDPYFVDKVVDRDGDVLIQQTPTPSRAVSQQTARLVAGVLQSNVEGGTGTRARLPEQPAAGKTGTAQNFADAWFVGFTPYLSTAVWMGAPEGSVEMRNVGGVGGVTGGSFPARIWGAFNTAYHDGRPVKEFTPPERTRGGYTLRTPQEAAELARFAGSACGRADAEVDFNGDGVVDSCRPGTVLGYRYNTCPRLMTPVDTDGDGTTDSCVPAGSGGTVAPPTGSTTSSTIIPP